MKKLIKRSTDTFFEILVVYGAVLVVASLLFWMIEAKDFTDSLWWACVTATTVGYGDVTPTTVPGRILGGFLMHIVPFLIAPLLVVRLMNNILEDEHHFSHAEQEDMKAELTLLRGELKSARADLSAIIERLDKPEHKP